MIRVRAVARGSSVEINSHRKALYGVERVRPPEILRQHSRCGREEEADRVGYATAWLEQRLHDTSEVCVRRQSARERSGANPLTAINTARFSSESSANGSVMMNASVDPFSIVN